MYMTRYFCTFFILRKDAQRWRHYNYGITVKEGRKKMMIASEDVLE